MFESSFLWDVCLPRMLSERKSRHAQRGGWSEPIELIIMIILISTSLHQYYFLRQNVVLLWQRTCVFDGIIIAIEREGVELFWRLSFAWKSSLHWKHAHCLTPISATVYANGIEPMQQHSMEERYRWFQIAFKLDISHYYNRLLQRIPSIQTYSPSKIFMLNISFFDAILIETLAPDRILIIDFFTHNFSPLEIVLKNRTKIRNTPVPPSSSISYHHLGVHVPQPTILFQGWI